MVAGFYFRLLVDCCSDMILVPRLGQFSHLRFVAYIHMKETVVVVFPTLQLMQYVASTDYILLSEISETILKFSPRIGATRARIQLISSSSLLCSHQSLVELRGMPSHQSKLVLW
jgi:hypothetical protein